MQIFNSYTGRKEEFKPLEPGVVRMYVCGDTVYDFCHIGHARSKIAFDVVRRYFQYRGYKVTFVRNITDIDDNIIKRAAENGESVQSLTSRFTKAMHEDYDRLGLLRPDIEPKATEHVPGIIAMTQQLIDKGYAYVATNGDVMYSVSKFADYGKLSGRQLSDLRAGARVAVDEVEARSARLRAVEAREARRAALVFAVGRGPAGLAHRMLGDDATSCSARSFDIHGGGMDLKFPHHENEIAQSCAATGDRFANLWMHNGFVNVDNEKMSKSLSNFFRIRDVLDSGHVRDPEVLRFFLASSHYRGPINYSLDADRAGGCGADAAVHGAARTSSPPKATTPRRGDPAVRGRDGRRLQHAGGDWRPCRGSRPRSIARRTRTSGAGRARWRRS